MLKTYQTSLPSPAGPWGSPGSLDTCTVSRAGGRDEVDMSFTDPTYVREEIEANPIWRRAFELSELRNDTAPIGWSFFIAEAEAEFGLPQEPAPGLAGRPCPCQSRSRKAAVVTAQLLQSVPHHVYHSDQVDEWLIDPEDERTGPGAPRLSRSIACTLLMETPLEAYRQHPRLGGVGRPLVTKGADMGSIVHALMSGDGPAVEVCMIPAKGPDGKAREVPTLDLEAALRASLLPHVPGLPSERLIPAPNWLTKDAQKFQAEARARGSIPVLAHDLVQAKAAAAALPEKLAALEIDLSAFESELTILWESGGVAMKTRPDLTSVALGEFWDFKVTEAISESAFEAGIVKYGLDMQAAAACEGLAAVHPELAGRLSFGFIVCSWKPPFSVMVKPMGQAGLEYGRGRWDRAKAMWKRCLETNDWPDWGIRRPWEPKPWHLEAELTAAFQAAEEPSWAEGAGS